MKLIEYVYAEKLVETEHESLSGFLEGIKNYLLTAIAALFILFIIIGGYQMITSAGNPEKARKGKKTLLFSIIGLVAILLSQVVFSLITGDLTDTIFGTGVYEVN